VNKKKTPNRNSKTYSKKRDAIIKKAIRLFVEHGYETTSMGDIAAACGMSAGNFYNYFDSKKDLVHATVGWTMNGFHDQIEGLPQRLQESSPLETLKEYIVEFLDMSHKLQHASNFLIHVALNLSTSERKYLLGSVDKIRAVFETIINAGVKTGDFKPVDAKIVSLNIYVLCQTWAQYNWYTQKHSSLEKFKKEQLDFILKGLAK